jgi:hypothetical protein
MRAHCMGLPRAARRVLWGISSTAAFDETVTDTLCASHQHLNHISVSERVSATSCNPQTQQKQQIKRAPEAAARRFTRGVAGGHRTTAP